MGVKIAVIALAAALVAAPPASPRGGGDAKRCAVTRPNGKPLPGLYGNGRLAAPTYYPKIIVSTRHLQPDGTIGEKFPWRAYGVTGDLRITGRRLDARSRRPLRARIHPGSPVGEEVSAFWAVGILFPTVGCWEITGRVGDAKLTFVTLVVDPLGLTKRGRG